MTKNIQSIKSKNGNLTWINIINAGKKEVDYLSRKFKFNEQDLNDAHGRKYAQRLKLYVRNNYCFLILQFPVFNRKSKTINATEIDFFITKDHLITVHTNQLAPMKELFSQCLNDKFYREQTMFDGNCYLLFKITTKLYDYCYPILDHISVNIKDLEKSIFAGHEEQMIRDILAIKRNIFNTRRILEPHRNAILKVQREQAGFLSMKGLNSYYDDLLEHTKNIWEILQGQRDLISALEDTNVNLVSTKLNRIMKTLTIFSVIVFPLTLLAAVFGMNTIVSMPFVDHPYGFWIIIGVMLIGTVGMFSYFKSKKWL